MKIDKDGNESEEIVYKKDDATRFSQIESMAKQAHELEMNKTID